MGTSFRRKLSDEGVIAMQGWLTKEPGNTFGPKPVWRQRYFRLSGSNLLYYEARLKGMITIDGGVARGWENKRVSVDAREVNRPTGPDHLRSLLRDHETATAFAKYCEGIHSKDNVNFYMAV